MSTNELMPNVAPDKRGGYEQWVVERATEFSTVLFLGRGKKDRRDWLTLEQAIAHARPNPRIMVYASMASGRSTMIGRAQYDDALRAVGSHA